MIHQTRETPLHTIEFRYMQASFNADDIMNWVYVVHRLVAISVYDTAREYRSRISWDDLYNRDPHHFLNKIGLGHLKFKSREQLDRETENPKDDKADVNNFVQHEEK